MGTVMLGGLFKLCPAPPVGTIPSIDVLEHEYNIGLDPYDGGAYYVDGNTVIDSSPDIPVRRRVGLLCQVSLRIVAVTWSDEVTGYFKFGLVRQGPWTVVSFDHTGTFTAVIADNLMGTPVT